MQLASTVLIKMFPVQEEWKSVASNTSYQVSNYGRVRRTFVLSPWVHTNGYFIWKAYVNGKHKRLYVHREVAKAFHVKPSANKSVDHVDRDKLNNTAWNLRWVSTRINSLNTSARGYTRTPSGKQRVKLCQTDLGTFTTEREAKAVYETAKAELIRQLLLEN